MYDGLKGLLLRSLKVPAEPQAPLGHADTLLTFRAAPNYYRYRLVVWGLREVVALIFLPLLVLVGVVAALEGPEGPGGILLFGVLGVSFLLLLAQLILSFLAVRLDYEMRWYLVTDQSLRIREGIFNVREMTMTFANIQNISISQGPLQRLLGVADLEVKSAGGGGGGTHPQAEAFSMHKGYFRGVDNAEELRDLMRDRMRKAKGTGLGDPDDLPDLADKPEGGVIDSDLSQTLADMRSEARALRAAAESA